MGGGCSLHKLPGAGWVIIPRSEDGTLVLGHVAFWQLRGGETCFILTHTLPCCVSKHSSGLHEGRDFASQCHHCRVWHK